ncbi:MAG: enoyl-CoA hydratase/isomerase family protein [Acidobacteriota bacterium]
MVKGMIVHDYETLKVTQEGNVVTAFLHRPDSRNAINMRMVNDLRDLIDKVEDANDVAVLVLRGSPDVFTSGIDLREFGVHKRRDIYGLQKWERMCRDLERLNKFTIAAVQGECTGGGFQLVLLCDARIAERRAAFCLNEVKLGFLPGLATFRLAKYVGLGRAKNIMLTGRNISAKEALDWGILDRVCDQASFEDTLTETVDDLLSFHAVALEMARRLLDESYATSYEDFLGHFLAAQHRAINSEAFDRLVVKAASSEPRSELPWVVRAGRKARAK